MPRKEKQGRRSSAPSDGPLMDINTTPLIDVMLVLLIMLIITIPIQLHSVNLNMPTGNPPPSDLKPEVLRIDIDALSVVQWNGEPLADRAEMERRFEQVAAQAVQPEVHLRPDRRAKYEVVAGVMASAQRTGVSKLGIVGAEQFIP
ncbi:outer membrane transport energization protein ExbD [Variovorax beijingensis]|uniref:Outer membrane transport energization protein ExbD n=2 Tax=Variovorax TaxID=34072 RepID=A0A561C348_9BURK|nr:MULTISPECIES: biopolymer transporter ExbD [Variovorax]MBD9667876.1 biopolymer transporter ExbD [Variovorax sp. VRV01]MDP9964439.1 biopolymer transport protein ExbD [Variovorax paradoxus]TWD85621.1 outer membrane transport energization protein ExbD [Variovorax beijingensis]